ncbi:MAG: hypothetical protein HOV71_20650 [Hamadaea sp.]|nr:hypothetical protein [Hamadaea sp.]NUR50544.1 hypothetical protein [Hamadaea sp.]NUT06244.1 hypothetical protein [Hamadaea sp.]
MSLEQTLRDAVSVIDEDACRLQLQQTPDPVLLARLTLAGDELRAAIRALDPVEMPPSWRLLLLQSLLWAALAIAGLVVVPHPSEPLVLSGLIAASAALATATTSAIRSAIDRRTAFRIGQRATATVSVLVTVAQVREKLADAEQLIANADGAVAECIASAHVWLDALERHRTVS